MASKKRIWSKNELIIAYYIAKWDYAGLKISEHDFVEYIIGNTSVPSLRMQIANFRHLLQLDGYKLGDASQAMKDLVKELDNKTISQVRRMIKSYVEECEESIKILTIKSGNKEVNKKRDALNAQYQINFEKELAMKSRGRKLIRKRK